MYFLICLWCFWICSRIVSKLAELYKCTRRPHGIMVFDLFSPVHDFLVIPMLVFAPFWGRFVDAFWIVFGSTFGAFAVSKGRQHQPMRKLLSKKTGFLVPRRGGIPRDTPRKPEPPPGTPNRYSLIFRLDLIRLDSILDWGRGKGFGGSKVRA